MFRKIWNRIAINKWGWEDFIYGGVAILLGVGAGAGVWVFKRLIDIIQWFFNNEIATWLKPLGSWTVFLFPVVGGIIVALLLKYFVGQDRTGGVAGIMQSEALAGGRLRFQTIPAKLVASALSIGSGASVGPEDPSVQLGANLGSMIAQRAHFSEEQMRALVAAGAAAGIAAAFNAPIAGIFFSLEVILGELDASSMGIIVLASVASAVITQALSGPDPAFQVAAFRLNSAWELPLYLVLGILAGPLAALYVRLLYLAHDVFNKLTLPTWASTAIAGGIVGLVGLAFPQILGVGYTTIGAVLTGERFSLGLLLLLMVAKLILTPVSIGGGFAGGVFAPSLFVGALLGGAFGMVAQHFLPGLSLSVGAFAMVGMAAMLAGAVHAPLTAILLLFEMTNDYRIILPLMLAVVVSLVISRRLQPDSVYTLGLARQGIRLDHGRDVEVLDGIQVSEVMQTAPFTLKASDTLEQASKQFNQTHHHGAPILDNAGALVGMITLQDIDQHEPQTWSQHTLGEVCTRSLLVTYPDESIGSALRLMGNRNIGRLPVVARQNPKQLLGLLGRSDVVQAYQVALTRQAALRHRAEEVRLDLATPGEVGVIDRTVQAGSYCEGKKLKEIPWPKDCLVASLRRGRQVMIPRGETQLQSGDVLVIVLEDSARARIIELTQKVD